MGRVLTISDLSRITHIDKKSLNTKLLKYGVKPITYEAIYDLDTLDFLWEDVVPPPRKPGRPKGIPQKKKVISQTPSTS
jgi:hypothetical protein